MVTPVPRRRPWKLARELVSAGSSERRAVGLRSGSWVARAALMWSGATSAKKLTSKFAPRMLDEGLEILKGLWSGEPLQLRRRTLSGKGHSICPRAHWIVFRFGPVATGPPNRRSDGGGALGWRFFRMQVTRAMRRWKTSRRRWPTRWNTAAATRPSKWFMPTRPLTEPDSAEILTPFAKAGLTWWMEENLAASFWRGVARRMARSMPCAIKF